MMMMIYIYIRLDLVRLIKDGINNAPKTVGRTKPIDVVQYSGGGRERSSLKFAVDSKSCSI
jgi:hypothetical protein